MSRIRQEISSVQFQIDSRKANASMEALQDAARGLNQRIEDTKAKIKALGDVQPNNKHLLEYQKNLRGLTRDLNDVTRAQGELVKGVKAADQLWKAAQEGNIERLSVKNIKAGQRGLEQRMLNLKPDDAEDKKVLAAFKAVIEESNIVIKNFQANTKQLVETIKNGGSVSESVLSTAKSDLTELLKLEVRGSEEWKNYDAQLKVVNGELNKITETERRLAGEIVTVSDAMRMSQNLTKEAADERMRLANLEKEDATYARATLEGLRDGTKQRLVAVEQELDVVDKELAKQRELSDVLQEAERLRAELPKAEDEYREALSKSIKEKKEWLKYNNEELDAKTKIAELDERLAKTTNLKEQQKIITERKVAEEQLAQAQSNSAKQSEKLTKAREKEFAAEDKVKKIEEDSKKVLGGHDYDTERDKLDSLERKHVQLSQTLVKEKSDYESLSGAVKTAQEREKDAAIELAQAQSYSQKSLEDSISLLERQNKIETDPKKYAEQAAAIEAMRGKIKEMTGEWMSYGEAEQYAAKAGTTGFIATQKQMQQASQALERQRDMLIKNIQQKRKNNEATIEEEAQLKKVEAELKKMKFEMDNTGMSAKRMEEILEDPKSAKNIEELGMAVKRAQAQLKVMEDTVGKGNKDYEEMAAKTKKAAQAHKELESQFKASASSFDKAWSRLKTYIGLYMGAAVAIQKLTATMGDLLELSDKMGEVRKTTGFTADEVGRLSDNLRKLDVRTSLTSLMEVAAKAGQLGLKTQEDVLGFTEAANKMMIALPEMGSEAATELLKVALATGEIDKIRKQMEEGTVEGSSAVAVAIEKVGSTIDQLRANSAATAPAITDFVKRVGAVGAQSGISIDQVAALGSTVDVLGMRVEMSATALSRMIPAIKNNAFDIAKVIGVTPDTLRNLFDTGRGMEAILMIFQHIKDSGMDENSVEKMLGMGNMKEIMKELNQQGARAGIVFAGLSQNVDELRRQLGVANLTYEENIAIEQEFIKMNDTAAAKWERLKNQVEEAFVGDSGQKALGWIIDRLRAIVDLLTGSGGVSIALKAILTYLVLIRIQVASLAAGALKNVAAGLKNIGIMLGFIKGEMTALQWSNIFTALAGVVLYLVLSLKDLVNAVSAAKEALGEANIKTAEAIDRFEGYYARLQDTSKALVQSQHQHSLLSAEVDRLRKSTDGSAAASANLKDKEDKLKEAEAGVTKASNDHRNAIASMNSVYGQYLGFLLTEYDRAELVAAAHDKITAAIRREMLAKQQQAALDKISDKYTEDLADDLAGLSEELTKNGRLNVKQAAQAKRDLQKFMRSEISYNAQTGAYSYSSGVGQMLRRKGYDTRDAGLNDIVALWFNNYLEDTFHLDAHSRSAITGVRTGPVEKGNWGRVMSPFHSNLRGDYADTFIEMMADQAEITNLFGGEMADAVEQYEKNAKTVVEELKIKATDAQKRITGATNDKDRNKAYEDLATALEGLDRNISQLDPVKNSKLIRSITSQAESLTKNVDASLLTAARTRVNSLFARATGTSSVSNSTFGGTGTPSKNVWGSSADAESTDYSLFDVNELVARRNQMDKFKNVLKTDTDFKKVLAEDAALMKAIREGKVKETRESILAWYNDERHKIEQELHSERFSTNEGHWIADKKTGRRRNRMAETDYALAELDRYYSRRKEALEKARAEENISEELFNRQAELLEQEHLKKRSELRGTFTGELGRQETEQFRQWWDILEKQFELDHVKWSVVATEWSNATNAQIGRNNYRMQKDLTDMRAITVKHLNEIAKIIEKERPFDGITANLRKNLTDMDILLADLQKDGPVADTAMLVREQTARLKFLLGEAETAYQSTIDDVLRRMGEQGMTAWADEIRKSEAMKNALMAQLQTAYDAIQDAIKKESSQIKKQTDIWWADLVPGQGTSRKGGFERMLSMLGLQEEQVKRANSLISAGAASERVADRLAIKQMQVRLQMQETYYNRMRQIWDERIAALRAQGKEIDAQHAEVSKQLSLSEEQKKLDEQRVAIANQLEESQNRLYKELREWADLLSSSLQGMMEATHAGDAEYYNELAKLRLTGKGGPGAGTYVVIENEGTSSASAHYEHLNERQALERQHEIERENAIADAWKKMMDDINMKMSDMITDQINAMLQNASVDANTDAVSLNTQAVEGLTSAIISGGGETPAAGMAAGGLTPEQVQEWTEGLGDNPMLFWQEQGDIATKKMVANIEETKDAQMEAGKKMAASAQSTFAKMTQAANLYGIAYQAMSNDNLSTAQKFEMIALQAVGNGAIAALTTNLAQTEGQAATQLPGIFGKAVSSLGPIAGPIAFAAMTALLGGLMGMAVSKITKSKSQIAQVTGASVGAGRLTTGMLTYATGNVNEFTDPATLTPGRHYNVDAADGRTYRAKYTGRNPSTHITNGPEFHLAGEAGREAIIDAHTTRNIRMNEPEIWHIIQTLSAGGRIAATRRRRGRGVTAFADGNVDDFESMDNGGLIMGNGGFSPEMIAGFQSSLDRNNELLDRALTQGIKGVFDVYGKGGLVDSYDTGKKTVSRHGERY